MKLPEIKICGVTNLDDLKCIIELGADFAGFNFYAHSPRHVSPDCIEEILAESSGDITKVGVFVNEAPQRILEVVDQCSLDIIQLHGDETAETAEKLGPERVWKTFHLWSEDDIQNAINFPSDAVVVDARTKTQRGGTGKTVDWKLAARLAHKRKLVLAGGLREHNIQQAIKEVQPAIIDVCSGVEKLPGEKDPDKLTRFIRILHETSAQ